LQFEVLAARIRDEYSLDVRFEQAPFEAARWLEADTHLELQAFLDANNGTCGVDHDGEPVFLSRNSWALNRAQQDFPKIRFKSTREQNVKAAAA
jgi:peptide chain release factor 3